MLKFLRKRPFGIFTKDITSNTSFGPILGVHRMVSAVNGCKLLVIAGPSGSGKSTIIKKLFSEFPDKFGFSISHTTRKPRQGEQDGVHYHFVSRDKMKTALDNGEFFESAVYSGNLYGTSKAAVQSVCEQGKICVLDIDTQGVRQVKEKCNVQALYVFVKPPSMAVLEKRLRDRKTDDEEVIQKRLSIAKAELAYAEEPGNFDVVVLNDDLEEAYRTFRETILTSFSSNGL